MHVSDRALVAAAKQQPDCFDVLYRKYYQTIYNYFWYRISHDSDVAEDLTQDTFIRAFQALSRFQDTGCSYVTYLLKIAHNILVNHYRSQRHVSTATLDTIPDTIVPDIEERDLVECLWWAIQDLRPTERDIIYLHYSRGYKLKEIAKIMDKSENAVKLQLSRARKRLLQDPRLTLEVAQQFQETSKQPIIPRYKRSTYPT